MGGCDLSTYESSEESGTSVETNLDSDHQHPIDWVRGLNPSLVRTPHVTNIWLARANHVREAIKRSYEYSNTKTGPIKVESEDLEKAKRIEDFEKGIINLGRM